MPEPKDIFTTVPLHSADTFDIREFVPFTIPCNPDQAEMLAFLGIKDLPEGDPILSETADAASECESVLKARGVYGVFGIDSDAHAEGIGIAGTGLLLPGKDIARHLDGAGHVVLMAVTLGLSSENWLRTRKASSLNRFLLCDAAASAMAESAVEAFEQSIRRVVVSEGGFLGPRYSPGYGDLSLDVQKPLLEALDAGRSLGIHLNSGGIMVPTKSITAIAGVFPETADADSVSNDCGNCRLSGNCSIRNSGRLCNGKPYFPNK